MFHGYIAVISIIYRFVEQRKTYFSYYPSMFHDCNLNNYFAHFLHNYFAHILAGRYDIAATSSFSSEIPCLKIFFPTSD
jgi:hypothetical protein